MFPKHFSRWALFSGLLILLFLAVSPDAHAMNTDNFLDRMIDTFKNGPTAWENQLRIYALRLFWLLAGIEFTITSIRLLLKGAVFEEFLAELFNRVLYIGFFLTLLMNSANWGHAIVDSCRLAGSAAVSAAGGTGVLYPSNVIDAGMVIIHKIISSMSIYDPGDSLLLAAAAIMILLSFAGMTAILIMALVESYLLISSGVILMGFGGASWTRDIAVTTLRYALAVGIKLFLIQLIMGLGQQLLNDWAHQAQTSNMDLEDFLMMACACLVFWAVTKAAPDMFKGLITGDPMANGHALSSTIAGAVAAGISAAASMYGVGSTLSGAHHLTKEQENDKTGQTEGKEGTDNASNNWQQQAARHLAFGGKMAQNTGKAVKQNLAARARGEVRYGNMPAQMGNSMHDQANYLKEKREALAAKDNNGTDGSRPNPPDSPNRRDDNRIYGQDDN